ncbi:MAG TPA: NfeD family protein [Ignavibacteria bacterium]|nr:NfeD family protein [Ignavibacteria bacterium]
MELFSALFWLIVGVGLMLLEIAAPGFILFFFGIGGLVTALAVLLGVDNIALQMIIFIVVSLLTLILFRKKWKNVFRGEVKLAKGTGDEQFDDYKGKRAAVKKAIDPEGLGGKVEFHGTLWNATSDTFIPEGSIVEIISRANLVLKVKKVNGESQ